MKPFTFSLMEQIQRADGALQIERSRPQPDVLRVISLARLRERLAARLRRSLASPGLSSLMAGA